MDLVIIKLTSYVKIYAKLIHIGIVIKPVVFALLGSILLMANVSLRLLVFIPRLSGFRPIIVVKLVPNKCQFLLMKFVAHVQLQGLIFSPKQGFVFNLVLLHMSGILQHIDAM